MTWGRTGEWLDVRAELPVGRLFCIVTGPTRDTRVVKQRRAHSSDTCCTRRRPSPLCTPRRFSSSSSPYASVQLSRPTVPQRCVQRTSWTMDARTPMKYSQGFAKDFRRSS
jgi:hypothetical protein